MFDQITPDDLIIAFFPCIYFCENSTILFALHNKNYKNLSTQQKIEKIIDRSNKRNDFYILLIKLFAVAYLKEIPMIVENPYSHLHYLKDNFLCKPAIVDNNRTLRGDYFKKPTQYYFVNCEPTHGKSYQTPKEVKRVDRCQPIKGGGICNEERSMISPDYARNFICDFILGKTQSYTQTSLF